MQDQITDIRERVARIEERTEVLPQLERDVASLTWKVAAISVAVSIAIPKLSSIVTVIAYRLFF